MPIQLVVRRLSLKSGRHYRSGHRNPLNLSHWRKVSACVVVLIVSMPIAQSQAAAYENYTRSTQPIVAATAHERRVVEVVETTTTTTAPEEPQVEPTLPSSVLPPGSALPTDEECAARVVKTKEVRPANASFNRVQGSKQPSTYDNWGRNGARTYLQRVTGRHSGTTDEIIQWAACKWGFDVDHVRAQIMVESSWNQNAIAGFVPESQCVDKSLRRKVTATSSTLPTPAISPSTTVASSTTTTSLPGTTSTTVVNELESTTTTQLPSVDVPQYECPTAFGLMQIRSDYQPGTYPMSRKSTAFNVDYGLAMIRACYEGVSWFGAQTRGDLWGCIGAFYSGNWRDHHAESYIAKVQSVLAARSWPKP